MPDHQVLFARSPEKVSELLQQGAVILVSRPERMVSLVGGRKARRRFEQITDQLWGEISGPAGQAAHRHRPADLGRNRPPGSSGGPGQAGFLNSPSSDPGARLDYIHYTLDDADVYFVSNQTESTSHDRLSVPRRR